MIPETITLRVVVVCDAVNRRSVSSSSSASGFEVLRCQILGNGKLIGLLVQPKKRLVGPDDVAELHSWSSGRLLANVSSQWDKNHETW